MFCRVSGALGISVGTIISRPQDLPPREGHPGSKSIRYGTVKPNVWHLAQKSTDGLCK